MSHFFSGPSKVPYLIPVRTSSGYQFAEVADPTWYELSILLTKYGIHTPLSFVPPELFVEIPFLHACNHVGVPATIGTVFNLPWTLAANAELAHDCIVSTPKVLHFMIEKMNNATRGNIQLIVLIHEESAPLSDGVQGLLSGVTVETLAHPNTRYV